MSHPRQVRALPYLAHDITGDDLGLLKHRRVSKMVRVLELHSDSQFSFEAFTGADGSPTTVSNAMFGFAPTYKIGKGSGHSEAFGLTFDARYGESSDFEFSSEMAGEVHPRA